MLGLLSAMLVMMESGSVPVRAELSVSPRPDVLQIARVSEGAAFQSPVRLSSAISDCDPSLIGLDPGADRLPNSYDLTNCLIMLEKGQPVGRAVLWMGGAGFQVKTDDRKVQLTVRVPSF
jgi:hypothetical protein